MKRSQKRGEKISFQKAQKALHAVLRQRHVVAAELPASAALRDSPWVEGCSVRQVGEQKGQSSAELIGGSSYELAARLTVDHTDHIKWC